MKVGIVVVTYLEENQKYLTECLKSIKGLNYPKELIDVVVIGSGEYVPFSHDFKVRHFAERKHYPEGVNLGVAELSRDCNYYFILNDDVILTEDSLFHLVGGASLFPYAIHQPVSNCDQGFRYILPIPEVTSRFYRLESVNPEVLRTQKSTNSGLIIVDWVPLYATLIPKVVWERVGPLDPNFKTGQDDVDYGKRARGFGVACMINLSSLVYHAGGATADLALTPEIRKENMDYFENKWKERAP